MLKYKYKIDREQKWLTLNSWSIPPVLHPRNPEEIARRRSHKPLSPDLDFIRRSHMTKLHDEGATYAIIGRLYGVDRSLVLKLVMGYL